MKIIDFFKVFKEGDDRLMRPYIIAEAGVNHEGSIELAKRLIDEAKEGGADAIKFQTYKAGKIASKDSPAYWDTEKEPTASQFELFKKYDKFWKSEFEQLKKYCDSMDIEFMSTPFDVESAHFLNDLMDVFKISSSDITNLPFIEILASYKKPIILSTGASYHWEIERALETISKYDSVVCLMGCILNYPTLNENANLGMLIDQFKRYPNTIPGYSDHTVPGDMEVLKIANLLGAVVLEKHFTHDKSLPGNDHYHAMDKEDLKLFHKKMDLVYELIGKQRKEPLVTENPARKNARRSLVLSREISSGEVLTRDHLTWKRPASGISPSEISNVLGKTVNKDLAEDDILKWSCIE
ncbi:N-acetylneuraminate synthase family protein [bacterium SCSIO 12643]|nr:N-acetylneuraminate synthase family protein [bacterium SCSIO 12643]